ncbi:MAG: [acyl-carrier-protein] S-malonyltransferase [Caldilineae bacterium]|nr:MAG: [acyl-carrier-protein] S-malonyltransferase [Caldilineae bacterium]
MTARLAFLFPGQGSQHVGMGQKIAAAYPAAQQAFDEADEVLGFGLSTLCFEGPADILTDTINAQPALLATSMALLRALESELGSLPRPRFLAGHSMGEYTALVAANSLSYADGLRLVRERGRLMKEAGEQAPGAMAAVLGLDESAVETICLNAQQETGRVVQIANDNCPGQIVISGDREAIQKAMEFARLAGARKVAPLAVSIAAHSPLMAPATGPLRAAIDSTPITEPVAPILANTTAAPITEPDAIRDELTNQLTGSVRWTASMQAAVAAGVDTFVEIGAGAVLTGLMKRIARKSTRINVSDPDGVRSFLELGNWGIE